MELELSLKMGAEQLWALFCLLERVVVDYHTRNKDVPAVLDDVLSKMTNHD